MKILEKAVAAVVRRHHGQPELLVFTHPAAGMQMPKGTIEPGESVAAATLRELEEESGLALDVAPQFLGIWHRDLPDGTTEDATPQRHAWHVSLIEAPPGLPERWSHSATGSPEEEGLMFDFQWLPLDQALSARLHPVFASVVALLLERLARPGR